MAPSRVAVLAFLSSINLVNFVDRGIISGAPIQFETFIRLNLGCEPEQTPVWLGLLTSSFIGCYSVACIVFSQLRHSVPAFRLLGIGLLIWAAALGLSAVPYWLPTSSASFWFFLLARSLSGVGEAAFQCIVPPYIEDFSPAGSKTVWLAVFYTAIPTGSALGYVYGSLMADDAGWGYAYLIEALLMAPTVVLVFFLPPASALNGMGSANDALRASIEPASPSRSHTCTDGESTARTLSDDSQQSSLLANSHPPGGAGEGGALAAVLPGAVPADDGVPVRVTAASDGGPHKSHDVHKGLELRPSVLSQVWWLLRCPPFCLIVCGYAAYTATVIGISSFGPLFLIGLGVFETEVAASTAFGITVALGGLVGTSSGGMLVDTVTRRRREAHLANEATRALPYSDVAEARDVMCVLTWQISLGLIVVTAAAVLTLWPSLRLLFLLLIGLGICLIFGTSAGTTRAVMLLVPPHIRSFAIALQTLGLHLLGDVPSPIVVGALQAQLAPSCRNHWNNATVDGHPSCRTTPEDDAPVFCCDNDQDRTGLFLTLLIAVLWMAWSGLCWGACWVVLRRRAARADAAGGADAVGADASCIN